MSQSESSKCLGIFAHGREEAYIKYNEINIYSNELIVEGDKYG